MTAASCCPTCGQPIRQTDGLAKPVAGLTRRQAELLRFIHAFTRKHGYAPSYEEMGNHLGYASKANAHLLVDCLVERGCLSRIPHKARSLSLTPAGAQFARAAA